MYVGFLEDGVYRTADGGQNWRALEEDYFKYLRDNDKQTRGARIFRELVFVPNQRDTFLFASDFGLLKGVNGGQSWQEVLTLIPPINAQYRVKSKIKSLVINQENQQQIYYGTEANLHRSFDGGKTWLTSALPSDRIANQLVIDWQNDNILYMGLGGIIKP